jgi:hypothetical protein
MSASVHCGGLDMRRALAATVAAAFALGSLDSVLSNPALGHDAFVRDRWPDIPAEIGVGAPLRDAVPIPYRCSNAPVNNFYDGAYYGGEPPAVFLGYAYRPYYRYTAYRIIPRMYFCSERR